MVGRPKDFRPLILDDQGRLYLHRYWQYEASLAVAIQQRVMDEGEPVDDAWLAERLKGYFPDALAGEVDWQKMAAFTAMTKRLCVISGGPGTGKTRTAAVLLAMLLEQAGDRPRRIALAAPTGKAAARLQESIKKAKATLPCGETVKARLPEEAATVHRLLGTVPDSAYFRHNADNPLPFEVVVIDEASMVDLALMAKLFAALPPQARVILLGDKDQLASVEAGAVLGDVCHSEQSNSFSAGVRTRFRDATGEELPATDATPSSKLSDCIVQLQKNYRFGADNGILALSRAVNTGDATLAFKLLHQPDPSLPGIAGLVLPSAPRLKEALRERVKAGFAEVLQAGDARTALAALHRFRILCALRQGPFGVENLNRLAEEILCEAGLITPKSPWYGGRPVMVTQNDYHLKLFNGDVGIIFPQGDTGSLGAFFLGADNEIRSVPPLRLPPHETVFATTVHKSQGSEFQNVLLLLPDRDSPVLTRELVYTGVTRASQRVEVWFSEPVLRAAVARRVERASGLREALWGSQ